MIPQHKQFAVKKALQSTFNVNEFESIQQLTKGLSTALVFKIIVHEKPYLLRVITRTDEMADPTYYYNCMQAAAEKEIAPQTHYLNIEDRISITDFVNEQPFSMAEAKEMMPKLLRKLHALPRFPFRTNYFERMESFMQKFRATNIIPENEMKEVFELYTCMANVYPKNDQENWVSCHNDVKPENFVFDGFRPWLIDWESAFLNDRYLDLAMVANFVVKNGQDEANYLENYFGGTVDEYEYARFFIMRQILHVYYFTFLLLIASDGKEVSVSNTYKNNFREFHDEIWKGNITLEGNKARLQYGLVHLEQLRQNVQTKRFDDALRIVSAT